MKRILISIFVVLLVSAISYASVWPQATAEISGTVRDQTGAVLPGVEVTATQTGTGIARSAITNETGSYILPNLAVGPYRLEAALPGFQDICTDRNCVAGQQQSRYQSGAGGRTSYRAGRSSG